MPAPPRKLTLLFLNSNVGFDLTNERRTKKDEGDEANGL